MSFNRSDLISGCCAKYYLFLLTCQLCWSIEFLILYTRQRFSPNGINFPFLVRAFNSFRRACVGISKPILLWMSEIDYPGKRLTSSITRSLNLWKGIRVNVVCLSRPTSRSSSDGTKYLVPLVFPDVFTRPRSVRRPSQLRKASESISPSCSDRSVDESPSVRARRAMVIRSR